MDLRERITLVDDPVWTDRYEAERDRLREVADDGLLGVFHVGSTAVPDLAGKPALDVLAVFDDAESMRAVADALVDRGYERHADESEFALVIRWEDDGAAFVKLHLRDDEKVRNQLLVTEYLRENPDARREYERVKREAAEDHPEDPRAYTQAKAGVVQSLLDRAREEGYEERLPAFA